MNTVEVAAGLVFREGRLLITQRFASAHLGGKWEFPGGKREPGETFQECLRRELMEELGILVEVEQLVESVTHAYPDKKVQLEFFQCRLVENEPQPLGCPAFAWVTRDELKNYVFPEADAQLIEKLQTQTMYWA